MTLKKLKGAALIINALMPFASGLAIVILLITLGYDAKYLLDGPISQLRSQAVALGIEVAKTGEAVSEVLGPLRSAGYALAQAQQRIQQIPEQLQMPAITLPPLDLRLQPSVRVASRLSPGASLYAVLSEGVGVRPAAFVPSAFRRQPALWQTDSAMPVVVRAGLSLPKLNIPTPSIPRPSLPNPVPSVRVEWHNRRVQLPAIPATTIPVSGLQQVKGMLSQNTAILGDLKQLVGALAVLATLRDHVAAVVDNVQPWLRSWVLLGGKMLCLMALVTGLIVPIWWRVHVAMYMRHQVEQLRTGWALLNLPNATTRTT